MLIPALLLLQAATTPALTPDDRCVALMKANTATLAAEAARWEKDGGGLNARQCLGLAYAARQDWATAATTFEDVATAAAAAADHRAPTFWAQAGNAWLAAAQPAKAIAALDTALADTKLEGFDRGEAELDLGRALVATGDKARARTAIDRALALVADDPLAWLLSATLARQTGDLARAKADIGQTLRRAADDAAVQLEAGNIAAATGDEPSAKAAWSQVIRLSPDSPQAKAAEAALAQFD